MKTCHVRKILFMHCSVVYSVPVQQLKILDIQGLWLLEISFLVICFLVTYFYVFEKLLLRYQVSHSCERIALYPGFLVSLRK